MRGYFDGVTKKEIMVGQSVQEVAEDRPNFVGAIWIKVVLNQVQVAYDLCNSTYRNIVQGLVSESINKGRNCLSLITLHVQFWMSKKPLASYVFSSPKYRLFS
jgi:hypothetical protein